MLFSYIIEVGRKREEALRETKKSFGEEEMQNKEMERERVKVLEPCWKLEREMQSQVQLWCDDTLVEEKSWKSKIRVVDLEPNRLKCGSFYYITETK